jgi:hypothetical protein
MQPSARLVILASLAIAMVDCDSSMAQMFGNRPPAPVPNTGLPNNPAAGAGATISGTQNSLGIRRPSQGIDRFLRQNRARQDFVGQSRADINSFIGAQQALAVGQVRSATEDLRLDTSTAKRVNRPLPPQPIKGIYYPKLELDLSTDINRDGDGNETSFQSTEPSREVDTKLVNRLRKIGGPNVQVDLSGTTATLSGQVGAKRAAELVEQLLSFEPGIDQIVNRLSIGVAIP